MRLIDADALAKLKFHGYPDIEITPSDVNAEAYKRGWNDAIDAIIDEAPTIDAVKHGVWEIYVISMFDGEGCRCSECGFEGVPYWDFCPNCGAKIYSVNTEGTT